MDHFIFITRDFHILALADRLKDDGKEVLVGMIDEELHKTPTPKHEARLNLYDNILPRYDADDLMEWAAKAEDKDEWWFHVDYNDMWEYAEKALKMGFTKGAFPVKEDYEIENDRELGKEIARKHYPELHVAEVHEFKSAEDGIKFMEENRDKIFVLKAEAGEAETCVPMTDDADLARQQIIGALNTDKAEYEKGYTLEEKIRRPVEISPTMVFWNGVPLYSTVELENKNLGSGNIGRLTGGCQSLTIQTPLDCPLNKIAFPPYVSETAKKRVGLSVFDAGLLYEGKNFNFGEFAGNRFGFDGFYANVAMSGDQMGRNNATNFFDLIAEGKNPIINKYGACVRLFQTQPGKEDMYAGGCFIDWFNEVSDQLFLYCIEGKKLPSGKMGFISNGFEKEIGVATGTGETHAAAIHNAYRCASGVAMNGLYYRPAFDFTSRAYFTSILNRLDWLSQSHLL